MQTFLTKQSLSALTLAFFCLISFNVRLTDSTSAAYQRQAITHDTPCNASMGDAFLALCSSSVCIDYFNISSPLQPISVTIPPLPYGTNDMSPVILAACNSGACCSVYGYCGNDVGSAISNGTCGHQGNINFLCPSGLCCQNNNTCSVNGCGSGCQPSYGSCNSTIPIQIVPSVNQMCGAFNGTVAVCSNGQCCSAYGYCGTDDRYCGTGCLPNAGFCSNTTIGTPPTIPGNTTVIVSTSTCGMFGGVEYMCGNNLCCSSAGTCGSTPAYCTAGCLQLFGRCDNGTIISNTTCASLPPIQYACNAGLCCGPDAKCTSGAAGCSPTPSPPPSPIVVSTNGTCGVLGNQVLVCSSSQCCSSSGFCGSTLDYCGTGCQVGAGVCFTPSPTPSPPPPPPPPVIIPPTTNTTNVTVSSTICGSIGGVEFLCVPGMCCSSQGLCGTTANECGVGCRSAYGSCSTPIPGSTNNTISTNGTCGTLGNSTLACPSGQCCSQFGFCGNTVSYCGSGCQVTAGTCLTPTPTPSPPPTIHPIGGNSTNSTTSNSNSTCGAIGGVEVICSAGLCCSSLGYCSNSTAACGTGCLPSYGSCGTGLVISNTTCGVSSNGIVYTCASGFCLLLWD